MRKISTPFLSSPHSETKHQLKNIEPMLPSDEIVKKIMQFATSYRVEKVPENQFLDYYLN